METAPAQTGTGQPGAATPAWSLVDTGLRACEAYGRADLAGRLRAAQRALADPAVHVVVVGEFKQGKSSLVNALVGAPVCPVDDDVATAVPTYVRYGAEPAAALLYDGDPPDREPVGLDQLRDWVVEQDRTAAGPERVDAGPTADSSGRQPARPAAVEVRLPRRLLAGGLVLVDTPGVGGLGSTHATASLAASSMADALLFVTDASQELTESELHYLRQAQDLCPTVACALTKTDLYPAWRRIRELDAGHLEAEQQEAEQQDAEQPDAGPESGVPVIPVSSTLRSRALATNDADLNTESGFAELVRFVNDRIGGDVAARVAAEAAAAVAGVCEQLLAQFEGERAALTDPAAGQQVVDDLTAVTEQVEALTSAAARWQQTLSDGIADLTSDVEHDLRERIRKLIAEADQAIEAGDPADTWSSLQSWLESRVASEMLDNYRLLRERATSLSERVGEHFRQASGEVLTRFPVANPAPLATSVPVDDKVELARMKVGKQAMVALKAGYGGAIMFVMLGVTAGITLGPLALGIGLIMGHKGLRDEKQRQVAARRTEARNAVRRYCDQVSFVMTKDSKDTLRRINRELRDHYTALAEQCRRSNTEALRAARAARDRTQADRQQRMRDLDAELGRLRQLQQHAEQQLQRHVETGAR